MASTAKKTKGISKKNKYNYGKLEANITAPIYGLTGSKLKIPDIINTKGSPTLGKPSTAKLANQGKGMPILGPVPANVAGKTVKVSQQIQQILKNPDDPLYNWVKQEELGTYSPDFKTFTYGGKAYDAGMGGGEITMGEAGTGGFGGGFGSSADWNMPDWAAYGNFGIGSGELSDLEKEMLAQYKSTLAKQEDLYSKYISDYDYWSGKAKPAYDQYQTGIKDYLAKVQGREVPERAALMELSKLIPSLQHAQQTEQRLAPTKKLLGEQREETQRGLMAIAAAQGGLGSSPAMKRLSQSMQKYDDYYAQLYQETLANYPKEEFALKQSLYSPLAQQEQFGLAGLGTAFTGALQPSQYGITGAGGTASDLATETSGMYSGERTRALEQQLAALDAALKRYGVDVSAMTSKYGTDAQSAYQQGLLGLSGQELGLSRERMNLENLWKQREFDLASQLGKQQAKANKQGGLFGGIGSILGGLLNFIPGFGAVKGIAGMSSLPTQNWGASY